VAHGRITLVADIPQDAIDDLIGREIVTEDTTDTLANTIRQFRFFEPTATSQGGTSFADIADDANKRISRGIAVHVGAPYQCVNQTTLARCLLPAA
jgi:hypothetical protein